MKPPLISIIVLSYNSRRHLPACLDSLLDQTLAPADYEIIVADNASTDDSAGFVRENYPEISLLQFEHNLGYCRGNNQAAQMARGHYLIFQNPDTIAHRRWLEEMLNGMRSDPAARACHPAALPLTGNSFAERDNRPEEVVLSEICHLGCIVFSAVSSCQPPLPTLFIGGFSAMLERSLLDELAFIFDPNFFMYGEDLDLGLRINNQGYRVLFVPQALVYHERNPAKRYSVRAGTLKKAYLLIHNQFLAYYQNMAPAEFWLATPLLIAGAIYKVRTFNISRLRRMVYAAGLVPVTLIAFLMALLHLSRYNARRQDILSRRTTGRFWLLKQMWRRRWVTNNLYYP